MAFAITTKIAVNAFISHIASSQICSSRVLFFVLFSMERLIFSNKFKVRLYNEDEYAYGSWIRVHAALFTHIHILFSVLFSFGLLSFFLFFWLLFVCVCLGRVFCTVAHAYTDEIEIKMVKWEIYFFFYYFYGLFPYMLSLCIEI